MYEAKANILGLMSGTSMDGMDAALCHFSDENAIDWKIRYFKCFDYPEHLKVLMQKAQDSPSTEHLTAAEMGYAQWCIEIIEEVKAWAYEEDIEIHGVGIHGQTLFHQPEQKLTYQAGVLPIIAKETGLVVVGNFRIQDVLLGGQGAPLVPFGDQLLFSGYEGCLNLGGFANLSKGNPTLGEGVLAAFDIAPANIVLNELASLLGHPFDNGGEIARKGMLNGWILDQLDSLEYYEHNGPKSLGVEWVEKFIDPIIYTVDPQTALATYTEHLAQQIVNQLPSGKTLVTGGGAFNQYLMERIELLGGNCELANPILIEAKEALIFALLAHQRLLGRANVYGHTTGSGMTHSSGVIHHP